MGRGLRRVSPAALEWFLSYDYPGNVRELENLIERTIALESGVDLSVEHLPDQRARPPDSARPPDLPDAGVDLDGRLEELERALIEAALKRSGGVRKDAANLLHLSERSLRYRMSKLGLSSG